ncbi:MAG: hypothetical protein NZ879_02465 [Archaeoglobaceae archaeon]|nr:hypothetical protein [Archaeoglobaceae archaeon]MDW8117828.1 hypothetical protein [Archaeoglobaceae archaeon]
MAGFGKSLLERALDHGKNKGAENSIAIGWGEKQFRNFILREIRISKEFKAWKMVENV